MTTRVSVVCTVLSVVALPGLVKAQEAAPLIYATYYECDPAGEERADAIMTNQVAPVFDDMVSDGAISGYGWLAHNTGGNWRRAGYFVASNMNALIDAGDRANEAAGDALEEIRTACPRHDDYIWEYGGGSQPADGIVTARPSAGFSMYAVCAMDKQDRADEIMAEVIGPLHQTHVDQGHLRAWSWWKHHVGGKYRRLLVLDGPDHKQVSAARDAVVEELMANHGDAFREFNSICGSHQDYMWDIQISAP